MLHHPTLEKLQTLRLMGMYKALIEQMNMPESETLSFCVFRPIVTTHFVLS